jgi:hypothetical protein
MNIALKINSTLFFCGFIYLIMHINKAKIAGSNAGYSHYRFRQSNSQAAACRLQNGWS